ncbi:hypothetical protein K353_05809 [Kitasatospora sp. SolWspMP-SS2h]|uniref:hypothetical protein n=1 Tax=Kitasatospora sp. SolWspMP-SS2h TaxID=1305729 RepID=UPI000DC00F14|nr:hypothetical protein [Kitasatospora sp. SolWspMP-SS2h]RAJ32811.1 hypothetical protein K353_05809 [Kitasatospora sp. SolWspMP-SS2h]
MDDVGMTNRISALVSISGAVASVFLLLAAIRQYRSGGSALWLAAGVTILLCALFAVVRDVKRLRAEPTT